MTLALEQAMAEFGKDAILVHGACRGADVMAVDVWSEMGGVHEPHPADWGAHGKSAGPIRNQAMVDLGADVCLAFPTPSSRGTIHCMNAAKAAHIPVREFTEEVL